MVDTAKGDTVRAALVAGLSPDSRKAAMARDAELRAVSFSYAELVDWSRYFSRLLYGSGNDKRVSISGIGVDPHRVNVEIAVRSEADRERLETWLSRADIPCGLVVTSVGEPASTGPSIIETSVPRRP